MRWIGRSLPTPPVLPAALVTLAAPSLRPRQAADAPAADPVVEPDRPSRLHRGTFEDPRKSNYKPARIDGVPVAAVYDGTYRMGAGSDGLFRGTLPPPFP